MTKGKAALLAGLVSLCLTTIRACFIMMDPKLYSRRTWNENWVSYTLGELTFVFVLCFLVSIFFVWLLTPSHKPQNVG